MESKFHRWWLGSCVAALLLASWAGGFSVAVTAVFVVIYLTGVTLVGPEDVADVGLAVEESPEPAPAVTAAVAAVPAVVPAPVAAAAPAVAADAAVGITVADDAEPYPDDEAEASPQTPANAEISVVETSDGTDTAALIVETHDGVDTAALVVETPDEVETTAMVVETGAAADTAAVVETAAESGDPERSPA